jgi:hypothetical protein
MTALCARRRDLKTAPIEFSDSATEKDCHGIRNNGEWRCSLPIGVNFSKHITRSHDLQTQHREHKGAEYTERNSGHKSPRAPQQQRAPWATRAFLSGYAESCGSHKPHHKKPKVRHPAESSKASTGAAIKGAQESVYLLIGRYKSPRAPQQQRAPWATRAFLSGYAQSCGSHKPHP